MIINPFVAAAATVAARAANIFPRDWSAKRSNDYQPEPPFREAFPTNQNFMDIDENMHEQARDLEDFMAKTHSTTNNPPIDAEILSKEPTPQNQSSRKSPPPLPNTNDPLILLGLDPGASFDAIRRAYKGMVKLYHPDVVVAPDASADERQVASWDFAQINAAFDILKRKENEEAHEYSVYVNGERVTRSVAVSEEARQRDPTFINYDRIIEMAEYRKRHPKAKMWYEDDHDYQSRHNNYEGNNSNYNSYSRGKWGTNIHTFEHDHDIDHTPRHHDFGPIPSNEKMWEERQMPTEEETGDYRRSRHSSFGVNPTQDQWGNVRPGFDFESHRNNNHEYQQRNSQRFDAEMKQGYPYKDRYWNEGPSFDEARCDQPNDNNGYDYDPQEYFPQKEKWWQVDDHTIGDFAP
mmetsp:Transcript_11339/g.20854  ORF Transcript_11339/g.20854 Transcript_11339/m.20854 type:complete len:407 (+) Transcript_11339:61-1281(+)